MRLRDKHREIVKYRELIKNLVLRDLKIKYKGSVLGFFWSLLNPFLMLLVYTFAFDYVIRIRAVNNFPMFFMCAYLPWSFFHQSLSQSVTTLVDNANLIKKIYFPREILPISIVLSAFVNFLLTFIILFPALLVTNVKLGWMVSLLPVLLFLHVMFTIGLSQILAILYVKFRDIKHLLEVTLNIWFWVTPIVYPMSLVPEKLEQTYTLNPMAVFIEVYRALLLYATLPNLQATIKLFVYTFVFFLAGVLIFRWQERNVAEEV